MCPSSRANLLDTHELAFDLELEGAALGVVEGVLGHVGHEVFLVSLVVRGFGHDLVLELARGHHVGMTRKDKIK